MQRRTRNIAASSVAVAVVGAGLWVGDSYHGAPSTETPQNALFLETGKGGQQFGLVVMGEESAQRTVELADGVQLEPWCYYTPTVAGSVMVRSMIVDGQNRGNLVDIDPTELYPSPHAAHHVDANTLELMACDQPSPMGGVPTSPAPSPSPDHHRNDGTYDIPLRS